MIIFVLDFTGKNSQNKKENKDWRIKKYNYDLLELINSNEKFIILISLLVILEDYSEANSIFIERKKS